MRRNLLNLYVWLVDTIRRHRRITLSELNRLWMASEFSQGQPLSRRSFANYRVGAEELFKISILCDLRTFEYYIDDSGREDLTEVASWLLDSAYTHDLLINSRDLADRIFVEEVPSAHEHLGAVVKAMRTNNVLSFDYNPYWRINPTRDVVLYPYFLKIFKQRWYVTGLVPADNKIKTYALDRITNLRQLPRTFEPDPLFDPREYFRNSFGIVFSSGDVKRVVLKVDSHQAKYFRALPLHHSQEEYVHDSFSIFHYQLQISPDLVEEILSHGSRVTVLEPPELRAMVEDELRKALEGYASTSGTEN